MGTFTLKKVTVSFIMVFYCVLFHVSNAYAQSIDAMVAKASFIFEGAVIDIQYRLSQQANGEPSRNSYTFVTYQIYRILKGNYHSDKLTLRFVGGIDEQGIMFSMDGTPSFDVGDHDLLLVGSNGYSLCPLVNCAQGRFRFIQGLVVNEYGQIIELNGNSLRLGQAVDLNEVNTTKMGPNTITRYDVKNVDGEEVSVAVPRTQASTGSMPDAAGFTSYMEQKVYDNHDPADLSNLPEFNSADPNVPFRDELLERIYTPAEDPVPENQREIIEEPAEDTEEKIVVEVPSLLSKTVDKNEKNIKTDPNKYDFNASTPERTKIASPAYLFFLILIGILLVTVIAFRNRVKRIHVPKQG